MRFRYRPLLINRPQIDAKAVVLISGVSVGVLQLRNFFLHVRQTLIHDIHELVLALGKVRIIELRTSLEKGRIGTHTTREDRKPEAHSLFGDRMDGQIAENPGVNKRKLTILRILFRKDGVFRFLLVNVENATYKPVSKAP